MNLTQRQQDVAAMALAMIDVDTLNDNLRADEQPETTAAEVDTIAAALRGPARDDLIARLAEAGYFPTDAATDLAWDPTVERTIRHFAEIGWDAVRDHGDSLTFARWDDDGAHLLITSTSGVVASAATFGPDPLGLRMFTAAAAFRPYP